MEEIIKDLKDKIKEIDCDRDAREQRYYKDKIRLSSEYETMNAALLSQKIYLKQILKRAEDNNLIW